MNQDSAKVRPFEIPPNGNVRSEIVRLEMVARPCPVCHKKNGAAIYEDANYLESAGAPVFHSPISYKFCSDCRLLYMDPAFSDQANFYIYSNLMIFPISEKPQSSPMIMRKLSVLEEFFESFLKKRGGEAVSILEIGSGTGEVLSLFVKKYNSQIIRAVGIEPSIELSRRSAARFNNDRLTILNCSIDNFTPTQAFDYIILDNVFEHLNEPLKIFARLVGFLRPQGAIYLSLPDILKPTAGTLRDIYSAHPQTYSTYAIEKIINQFNFCIEQFHSSAWHNHYLVGRAVKPVVIDHPSGEEIKRALNAAIIEHEKLTGLVQKDLQPRLDELARANKRLLIFGAGDHTISLFSTLNFHQTIVGLTDNNDTFWRQNRYGCYVYPPADVDKLSFDFVLISSYSFEGEIYKFCVKTLQIPAEKIIKIYSKEKYD